MLSTDDSLSFPVYKVYRRRFYVLFVFSVLSFNQCLFWITFSPISESVEKHYNISENTVDLFLAWGPIFFIPCLPLTYILLNKLNGLRYCVLFLSIIEVVSTIIRIIPLIFVSSSNPNYRSISLPFLHIGQILNALCGPLAMAPVSQLSSLWFNTNERTRATTVAIMSYNVGSTLGFILGPLIVNSPSKVSNLLYIHVGLALFGFVLTMIYFPSQPPTPPSPSAELLIKKAKNGEDVQTLKSYFKNLIESFQIRSFLLLVCGAALIGGTFGAWTSLFDSILTPESYSEEQSGWFGFSTSIAEILGGFCSSILADIERFNRSFKMLILISYTFYFLSLIWFNLSIHSIFNNTRILKSNWITIGLSVTLAGFFQGAASPLTYEAIAEFLYPKPESLSASILVQLINLTSLVLFFIAPDRSEFINFIILIIVAFAILLIIFTKFSYKRRDADQRKRNTFIEHDLEPIYSIEQNDSTLNLDDDNQLFIDTIQMDPLNNTAITEDQ